MKRYLGTASRALLAVITLLAGPALALEQAAMVTLAGKYNMLAADVGMIGYDPENAEYLAQATETLESIRGDMSAWIDSLPEDVVSILPPITVLEAELESAVFEPLKG